MPGGRAPRRAQCLHRWFSIGVSRLLARRCRSSGKVDSKPPPGPVVVHCVSTATVFPNTKQCLRLCRARIRVRTLSRHPKHIVGQQIKYADKRGSPGVVHPGCDRQKARGEVHIKDLALGIELPHDQRPEENISKSRPGRRVRGERDDARQEVQEGPDSVREKARAETKAAKEVRPRPRLFSKGEGPGEAKAARRSDGRRQGAKNSKRRLRLSKAVPEQLPCLLVLPRRSVVRPHVFLIPRS